MASITVPEAFQHEKTLHWSGARFEGCWVAAWVVRRKGFGDELLVQLNQDPQFRVLGGAGVKIASPAVFSREDPRRIHSATRDARRIFIPRRATPAEAHPAGDGASFLVVVDGALRLGQTATGATKEVLKPANGETLRGTPKWSGEDSQVLMVHRGARERLKRIDLRGCTVEEIFEASEGGRIGCFDSHEDGAHEAVVVHRLANAMLAEVVLLPRADGRAEASP